MIPGLWGAPLKLINGFSRLTYQRIANIGKNTAPVQSKEASDRGKRRGIPYNQLPCFHDYDEALAYAKKVHKPLLIDFTGWACNNCRKMNVRIIRSANVDKRLRNDVVLVSLYVDDKTELPLEKQGTKQLGDRNYKIKTIGNKWSFMQAERYKTNSQPQYILVDNNEVMLTNPTTSYDLPRATLYQLVKENKVLKNLRTGNKVINL